MLVGSLFLLFLFIYVFTSFPISHRLLCFVFSMDIFFFGLCWSFVANFVEVLVVAVFGLCKNRIMTVSLVPCIPTGPFE